MLGALIFAKAHSFSGSRISRLPVGDCFRAVVSCCLVPADANATAASAITATIVVAPAAAATPDKAESSGSGSKPPIAVIVPVVAGTFTVLGVLITGSYTLWKWWKKRKLAAAATAGCAPPVKDVGVESGRCAGRGGAYSV